MFRPDNEPRDWRPRLRALRCESLEDRRLLAVYTVDSPDDSGAGTLRDAIAAANATPGVPDQIEFASTLNGQRITLTSGHIEVTDELLIDAMPLDDGLTIDAGGNSRHLLVDSALLELRGLTFTGGYTPEAPDLVDEQGGSIWSNGELRVFDSTFEHNRATQGGAIYSEGALLVSRTLLYRNIARSGGGVFVHWVAAETRIDSSTLTENVAGNVGGAVYVSPPDDASFEISNSTLVGNRRSSSPDPFDAPSGSVVFDAISSSSSYTPPVVSNSLIEGRVSGALVQNCYFTTSVDSITPTSVYDDATRFDVDPKIMPLADNGGRTLSHAVLPGSPLVDAGDPNHLSSSADTDQRGTGFARVADGGSGRARVDVGAYELQALTYGPPGDFNSDGLINAADYTVWRDNLGSASVAPHTQGDADGDGDVDPRDREVLNRRYGQQFVSQLVVNDLGDHDDGDPHNGSTTLREAINRTNADPDLSIITFAPSLSGGTIEVGTADERYYEIESALTINATPLPDGITLDAGGRTSVFLIDNSDSNASNNFEVTLSGLTIRNGTSSGVWGAVIRSESSGTLNLVSTSLYDSLGGPDGSNGAIRSWGSVRLDSSAVEGGVAFAILSKSGDVTLYDSLVRGFVAEAGYVDLNPIVGGAGISARGNVSLTRSRVENNTNTATFGGARGGGISAVGAVSLIDSHVVGNSAQFGGGVYAHGDTDQTGGPIDGFVVTLVNSTIDDNTSHQGGSAIQSIGSISIVDSSVSNNHLTGTREGPLPYPTSGVVFAESAPREPPPTVEVVDSEFIGNTSAEIVNTIEAEQSSPTSNVTVLRSRFIDNEFNGIRARSVIDSTISGNHGYGVRAEYVSGSSIVGNSNGGIVAEGYTVSLVDSVVRGNVVESNSLARAAGVSGNSVNILGSVVEDNHGVRGGFGYAGGVSGSRVHLFESTIENNTLTADAARGAGVHASTYLVSHSSTISNNTVTGDSSVGGGVWARSFAYLVNSTVSGNKAIGDSARAGGVASPVLRVEYSTVSGNQAIGPNATAGGAEATTSYDLEGVVFAHNTAEMGASDLLGPDSSIVDPGSVAYSLIQDPTGARLEDAAVTDTLLGVDPLLGPLADNGGPTWTHALLAGSPAIDAGDPARTGITFPILIDPETEVDLFDQRGEPYARVADGGSGAARIDIGSFEVQDAPAPAISFAVAKAPARSGFRSTVRDQVLPLSAQDNSLLLIDTAIADGEPSDEIDLLGPHQSTEDPATPELDAAFSEL